MGEIVVFNETENITVDTALSFAARRNPDYHPYLCTARNALNALAHGISQIRRSQTRTNCEGRPGR